MIKLIKKSIETYEKLDVVQLIQKCCINDGMTNKIIGFTFEDSVVSVKDQKIVVEFEECLVHYEGSEDGSDIEEIDEVIVVIEGDDVYFGH